MAYISVLPLVKGAVSPGVTGENATRYSKRRINATFASSLLFFWCKIETGQPKVLNCGPLSHICPRARVKKRRLPPAVVTCNSNPRLRLVKIKFQNSRFQIPFPNPTYNPKLQIPNGKITNSKFQIPNSKFLLHISSFKFQIPDSKF